MESSKEPYQVTSLPSDEATRMESAEILRLRRSLEHAEMSEKEARRNCRLLNTILNLLPVGVAVQSNDGEFLLVNDTAMPQFPSLRGAEVRDLTIRTPLSESSDGVARGELTTTEDRIVGADGERTFLTYRRPVQILGELLLLSGSFDYTERKQLEAQLAQRAYVDDLTGLPNRTRIQQHVEQLIHEQPGHQFGLAFFDIDNFKHINDFYGHTVGDALLVNVAQRIGSDIRKTDMLGRISGDEFLLVIDPLTGEDKLPFMTNRLLRQLTEPFFIDGCEILTSASMGVSVWPDHGLSYELLSRAANAAMHQVKATNKGGSALFSPGMAQAIATRVEQEQGLRQAIRENRVCCAFQPKVDIRTQEVVGLEALMRLRDEDGVIRAPREFIGLAIELGLINDLARLALAETIRSMDLVDEMFGAGTTISINVAARQAGDREFMRSLCEELNTTNCASRFMIEITEEAYLATSHFQTTVLPMLRDFGVRVSIDDFGIGYSSLSALAEIAADEIKVDRSFISDIHRRPRSQSILKAVEGLGDALGVTVVAEGVETVEELAYLQGATRIRFAQGFYFAKPLFLEEMSLGNRLAGDGRTNPPTRQALEPRVRHSRSGSKK